MPFLRILLGSACLFALPLQAQDADALMDRFATAWSADDSDAIRAMLAADVVVLDNGEFYEGPNAVVEAWSDDMANTGAMTIVPTRSGETADAAYQVGRWTLDFDGGQATGSHHFTFRTTPEGARRIVAAHVSNDPTPAMTRAAAEEPVALMVNRVKPEMREQFEAFVYGFWEDLDRHLASDEVRPGDREAFEQTRVLFPAAANEDGTYTYVFLADPYADEANYSMLDLLRLHYDEGEAERRYEQLTESLAEPQEVILLEQSER